MSTSYSANQYESAFKSQNLQNWTIPKHFKERPSAADGYTTFIATDRGHLLPGLKTKRESAWPSFQGTWDLAHHFSPVYINPTARSQEGLDRLRGKTKSATSQAPKASCGSWATSRASQNMENQKVNQPAEESNPNQHGSEIHMEQPRPNSQQNQAESGQQVQPEQDLQNQAHSRPASQHSHPTRSRPLTQQGQVKTTDPVQQTSIASRHNT